MDIRQFFGEISGKEVIRKGEKVIVKYYENKKETEITGILIEVSPSKIKINGTTPLREINVDNIISIKKCDCSS
jgi:hypothetical protein